MALVANNGIANVTAESGSAIRPVYATRSMKCYAVTDSELKQIGLANLGTTITFGLGSACFAFAFDIFKDAALAGAVPTSANVLVNAIQPLGYVFGALLWIAAAIIWFWRRSMIKLIKEESENG